MLKSFNRDVRKKLLLSRFRLIYNTCNLCNCKIFYTLFFFNYKSVIYYSPASHIECVLFNIITSHINSECIII